MKRSYTYLKGLLTLALAALTGGLWAGVTSSFGVNFTSNANQNIPADTAAGFTKDGYAQPTAWTNVSGGSGVAVINTNGKKLLSWTSRGTWNSSADTSTNDGKLLYNYLDDTVNSGRQKASVTITGLPADKQYAVALILSGDADNDGFNGKYSPAWINGVTYSYVDGALVTGDAAVAARTWGNRRAANQNGPTTPIEGQNVMFVEGLSGSVLSITSAMEAQNTSRLTIAGIQVWVTDVDATPVTKPTDADVVSLNFHSAQTGGAVGADVSSGLVAAKGWMDLTEANGTLNSLTAWNGEKTKNIAMGLNFKSKECWGFGTVDAGYNYLRGYLDDGAHDGIEGATIELTNIPFEEYSVIVYAATDTGNAYFHSVKIGDKWYVGNATQTAIGYVTECYDGAKARWGASQSATAVYGTNALRLDGLTSESLTIQAGIKSDSARGGIAAIQIVNTGAKLSDAQVIDWTAQPANLLKISELPEITNPLVELKLADGATLIVDELPTTALSLISTGAVTITVTDLSISQAQLDAMFNTDGVTGGVTDDYTETIGYTKDGVTYPLIFRGTTDANWATLSNWYIGTRKQGETTYWIPYTGTVVPGAPNSDEWRATLVDGELMAIAAGEDGYKTVTLPTLANGDAQHEGWATKIAAYNKAHVVIAKANKFQSNAESGPGFLRVDDTSKITYQTYANGNGAGDKSIYVNAENGVVFAEGTTSGIQNMTYYFDGDGSVAYATLNNSQTIAGLVLDLGTADEGRKIVSRKLIGFTAGNATFTVAEGAVTTNVEGKAATEAVSLRNVGEYKFEQKEDGYYVSYVVYAATDEIGDASTWTATDGTAWSTEANWTWGIPAAGADAVVSITTDTTITIPAEGVTVGVLTVNGEGTLTIAGGKITAGTILANTSIAAGEDTLALAPMNIEADKTVTYTTTTTVVNGDDIGKTHALTLKDVTGAGTFVKDGTGTMGFFYDAADVTTPIVVNAGDLKVRGAEGNQNVKLNVTVKKDALLSLAAWKAAFTNDANSIKLEGGAQLWLTNGAALAGTVTIENAADTPAKICGSSFEPMTVSAAITGTGKVEFADGGAFNPTYTNESKIFPCQYATTYTGVISGELQVIISDTSAVTFTAANTYTGGTVIAEGVTVTVSNLTSIFGTGAITGAGTVKIAGGTYNGLSFAQYTDANTTIVIPADNTVTGYFNNATWTCAAKIQLDGALDMTNGFAAGKYTFTGPWAGAGAFSLSNNAPADVVRITGDISDFTGNISVAGARAITFCAATTATNQKYSGKICVHGDYAYTAKVNGTWSAPVMVENGAKIGGTGTIDNTITFNNGAIIDTSVTATGDVTLNGTVTVSGNAGATVLTCANAESLDLTKFAAPAGLRCVVYGNTIKLAVAGAFIVGGDVYETFEAAFAAAIEGEVAEITIDENAAEAVFETPGFKITKSVTIDLGGKTLRLTPPAVGSAGTETLGIQILKGTTVVIKNGTIDVAASNATAAKPIKMMINNYSTALTLTGVTLDGRNLVKPESTPIYVLSNNSGTVTIDADSEIIAPEGGIAFDVCKYSSYTPPAVTVADGATITGNVEITGGELTAPESLKTQVVTIDGYKVVYEGGKYTAVAKGAFEVNGVDYATLADAYAAGDTITLTADATAAGIKITKNVTLNLGGYTLSLTPPAVGSAGTETLGIQILKGTTVVINNGTIDVDVSNLTAEKPIKMMINNYSTALTLTGVTLDGTNLVKPTNSPIYVLSNNSGTVSIDADSAIIAPEGGIAFDVCKYASYAAPTVTVADGAEITGKVELSGGTLEGGATLTVESGKAGYKAIYDNGWTLVKKGAFEVNGTDYATLAEAYAAGDAITLTADATSAGIKITKSVTIDLGGKTLSLTPPAVGSAGTETLGMQIMKGTTVVIKNGTIDVDASNLTAEKPIKMMINNYSTALTLTGVTLDGTNLVKPAKTPAYTLSNNSGTVTIDATSKIIAKEGGIAFDVCKYASYTAPAVTVAEGATITGKVEITGGTLTDNTGALSVETTAGFILKKEGNVYTVVAIVLDEELKDSPAADAIKAAMQAAGVTEITGYTITTKDTGADAGVADVANILAVFDVIPTVGEDGKLTVAYEFGISAMTNNGGIITITAGVTGAEYRAGVDVAFYADGEVIGTATTTADSTTVSITDIDAEAINGKKITVKATK